VLVNEFSQSVGMPHASFSLVRDLIHDRTGIFFDDDKQDMLADKLTGLVLNRGFDNFLDYYYLLKYDPAGELEWNRVFDALSVQETFFLRERDQLDFLLNKVVPAYAREHPYETLRIWSAACASGEEPLSIAMLLDAAGWFERHPIVVQASDASESALQKAQAGHYRERSLRHLPAPFLARYFEKGENTWKVSPSLAARVRYRRANLASEPEISDLARSHAIFCRNVFIYFSKESLRKTVTHFASHILKPGYLFVGASESLLKITNQFELQRADDTFVYLKV
jgi:chemotaxis protein methyltransferase CheR